MLESRWLTVLWTAVTAPSFLQISFQQFEAFCLHQLAVQREMRKQGQASSLTSDDYAIMVRHASTRTYAHQMKFNLTISCVQYFVKWLFL
jgi:hypothetical protein